MKITESAVRRRIATSAIVIALVVLGVYGLWRLPVNFVPNITYPLVRLWISWPGATPEEIDKDLADPIERQLASVDGLDYLESSSIEGLYTASGEFQVRRRCKRGIPRLPGRVGKGFQEPAQRY